MSSTIRALAAIPAFRVQRSSRAFHSPFVALKAVTPLTSSPATSPVNDKPQMYEKQADLTSEPHTTSSGTRTYVVSEPDPLKKAYEVPYGAYSTTAPYANVASTENPKNPEGRQGPKTLSHPYPASGRAAPRN